MAVSMTSGSVGKRTRRTSCNTRQPTKEKPREGGGVISTISFWVLLSYLVEDRQLNTHRTCVASVFATNSPQFDNSHTMHSPPGKTCDTRVRATPGWVTRAATRSSQITVTRAATRSSQITVALLASQQARHDPWQERNRATDVDLRGSSELNGAGPRWAYPSLHHGGSWLHAERTVLC